ncbi:response regulator transcription factor [Tropicibacter oceani]|uniref:Response regulator n=1 Tax=Tropicibacter oceani TaxID=3058420 RepID=A0ABY8QK14_9RHOB|nr:response regulator [Tropicibacter oceani]WGW04964.1 response regulator [Tropicibacter oceani]
MVLIVESNSALALLWQRHLERLGHVVRIADDEDHALGLLREVEFDIIILDLVLENGSALSISDFANYRQPEARVIFVTNSSFFSDGSIFRHCANACAFMTTATAPDDLAAMVEHYSAMRA